MEFIDGVDESIHGLLDVIDLESYSTLVGVSQELVTFLDILCCAIFAKPSLFVIGLIEVFVALIFIGKRCDAPCNAAMQVVAHDQFCYLLGINVGTIIWRGKPCAGFKL